VRFGLIAVVAVLAFGAGVAAREWSDEPRSDAPKAAAPVGDGPALAPIRLIRADPGALRRPARERAPGPSEAPIAAAPAAPAAVAPAPPAPAPAPPPAPPAEPPAAPDNDSATTPEPTPDTGFDSEE
jgi:pyruvate dehydrogenase E2 component (dihydrolipoamide acetyltransferase)